MQVQVAANGRLLLPLEVRRKLGLEHGGTLKLQLEDDGLVLRTRRQMARRAQALARQLLKPHADSLVDALIETRRAEAAREAADDAA